MKNLSLALLVALLFGGAPLAAAERDGPAASTQKPDDLAAQDPQPVAADAALIGHYYLSGIMETGSELLLKPDGRFEWFMSYGNVDQFANGRWNRDKTMVVLTPDRSAPDAPLFRIDAQTGWNRDAEQRLLRRAHQQQRAEMQLVCPLRALIDSTDASAAALSSDDKIDPEAPARAAQSLIAATSARTEVERLAALAFATGSDRAAVMAQAATALENWYAAQAQMRSAYEAAKLDVPALDEPVLPKQCDLAAEAQADSIPESQWQNGIAVIIGDPAREMRISGVSVIFAYSDGTSETRVTDRGGWAIAPVRAGATVGKISLAMTDPVVRSATLTFAPLAQGIQTVITDVQQLIGPPFDTLHLKIDGAGLVPQEFGRGRYQK